MLSRIKILQVGDIHFPASATAAGRIDDKDASFPISLKNLVADPPLKKVFKKIYELISHGEADCIVFMGDFTDRGDVSGFQACCKYISNALQIGIGNEFSALPTGIVPGNHDINRNSAALPNIATKFAALTEALTRSGLPDIPIVDPIYIPVSKNGANLNVVLLNSCWGCGERMFIPAEFRNAINAAIDSVVGGTNGEAALSVYYNRQMDTPAFSEETIAAVLDSLADRPKEDLPVLVAHHNLLPQRLTRLAPYTELVNSGALRSSLLELMRPVLFLHGHIHEEPVEVINSPNGWPLVVISAPLITDGFNMVEIVYSPNHVPIAAHVVPYRFDGSGILRKRSRAQISLHGKRRRGIFPLISAFYGKLLEKGTSYWTDIVAIASNLGSAVPEKDVVEMLELLYADSLLEIDNYDLRVASWIVRAEV